MKNTIIPLLLLFLLSIGNILSENDSRNTFESIDMEHITEMRKLVGLNTLERRMKRQLSLSNSASRYLLEVYDELNENTGIDHHRSKRSRSKDNFLTEADRKKIYKCNNIITFSSRESTVNKNDDDFLINFNTNDVPDNMQLLHAVLRIYLDPVRDVYQNENYRIAITIYERKNYGSINQNNLYRVVTYKHYETINEGWLHFNITGLLSKWLEQRTLMQTIYGNNILVGATLQTISADGKPETRKLFGKDIGLIDASQSELAALQPFIIGFFNGPDLIINIKNMHLRQLSNRRMRRSADVYKPPPSFRSSVGEIYEMPKHCERVNFTLDFKELYMHEWVIAPKKFEAYFCSGECNFPLGAKMNATNHAIVQTLMHLKQPSLPKACCVPSVLGSITILHYLNEDSVNLSKYPNTVAKECGCH